MTSPLIAGYVASLHRRLPAATAEEAADGLIETYEHHLAAGAGQQAAAHAAVADFGDLETVIGEFTRQAPGRRAARILLAVLALAAAATSRRSYQRTRLAAAASPVILVLDATAVAAVALAAPARTATLGIAAAVSLGRIAFTAWTLPRLAAR